MPAAGDVPVVTLCELVDRYVANELARYQRRDVRLGMYDERPARWQQLRDRLHAVALGPLGAQAPALSLRTDVCPLPGRQHELWQPLLSLAAWLDPADETGLVASLTRHAVALWKAHQEEHVPEEDTVVPRALTNLVARQKLPTATHVLQVARTADGETFARATPRRISSILQRYNLRTSRHNGKRVYRAVTLDDLKRIERNYGIDLDTEGKSHLHLVTVREY